MNKIYKVFYKNGNGAESYTFIEADANYQKAKQTIKSVLHSVQGMNTKLVSFEEVNNEEEDV